MLTNIEKDLYNTYLKISRTIKNKPFSYRKDFSDMDDSVQLYLHRISNMLFKYTHINSEDYFVAPYKVYPNTDYFGLDFYAGMAGVNAYTLYMKQLQEMPPDSEEQLQFIKKSLKFIGLFCLKNKISLSEYPTHKTGVTYDWMKQVKKYEISIYVLMEFDEINNIIKEVAEDEKKLFLGDIGKYYWSYKSKYIQSKIAKILIKEGINKINKIINNKIN